MVSAIIILPDRDLPIFKGLRPIVKRKKLLPAVTAAGVGKRLASKETDVKGRLVYGYDNMEAQ